jgi:hypothetical protein
MKRSIIAAVATMCLLVGGHPASAATYLEVGDAGQALSGATILPGGTDRIRGEASFDADLFRFNWGGGDFYVNSVDSRLDVQDDYQLFLFDGLGFGIQGNDDGIEYAGPAYLQVAGLAAGAYFLGISYFDLDPVDDAGELIFRSFEYEPLYGPNPGVGALASWGSDGSYIDLDTQLGNYEINFGRVTGDGQAIDTNPTAAVPEPGTLLLLGAGLAGLAAGRRKSMK